jgi:hypothetical protein
VATGELWFHLYLNAFASDRSTFSRELGPGTLRSALELERAWGWTRVTSIALADGRDLMPSFDFQRPDDGNSDDFTVARVVLPHEVAPGESVELELEFEAVLPRVIARTGFSGDFHMVGQWFPKLGVFQGETGWNCHQMHANSEFFSDFGSYRVAAEVPESWVVGATGIEVGRERLDTTDASTLRVTWIADGVHDFAWCAAPGSLLDVVEAEFDPLTDVPVEWVERAAAALGRSPADLELPPVHLRLLLPHAQRDSADRILNAARLGLAWYGLWYGAYPWPQLTVIAPPTGAEEAAGMEYPTLITTECGPSASLPPRSWTSAVEGTTVHEIGHQNFQGLLASNEFEQAWLDEGLTSWSESQCMEAIVADDLAPEVRFYAGSAIGRLWLSLRDLPLQIDRRSWAYRTRVDYFTASYTKTAIALRTLEGILGRDLMARSLRAYAEAFRYRHPTGDDFFRTMSESSGQDLRWFFDQAFRSDKQPDWGVARVRNSPHRSREGMVWDGEAAGWRPVADAAETSGDVVEETEWTVEVDVARVGDFIGPVVVRLVFADGRDERRTWDGGARWVRWSISSDEPLTEVQIDPDGVWALETARADNYWRRDPDPSVAAHWSWWTRPLLQLVTLVRPGWG